MPRPGKSINSSPLHQPVAASRGARWSKHAGPEHADQYEPDSSVMIDAVTQETEVQIDLVEPAAAEAAAPAPATIEPPLRPIPEVWTSDRVIEGRTYRRTDRLVPSDVDS